ncbi:hypothetical protein ACS4RR_020920 [Rhizobium sp. Z1P35]
MTKLTESRGGRYDDVPQREFVYLRSKDSYFVLPAETARMIINFRDSCAAAGYRDATGEGHEYSSYQYFLESTFSHLEEVCGTKKMGDKLRRKKVA